MNFAERNASAKNIFSKIIMTMSRYHLNKPSSSHIRYMTRETEMLKLLMSIDCISTVNQIITTILYQILPFKCTEQPEIKRNGLTSGPIAVNKIQNMDLLPFPILWIYKRNCLAWSLIFCHVDFDSSIWQELIYSSIVSLTLKFSKPISTIFITFYLFLKYFMFISFFLFTKLSIKFRLKCNFSPSILKLWYLVLYFKKSVILVPSSNSMRWLLKVNIDL